MKHTQTFERLGFPNRAPIYSIRDEQGHCVELCAKQALALHLWLEQQLDQIQADIIAEREKRLCFK